MFQYRQVGIHEPFHAILYAALLLAGELAGGYRARNAFLEAGFGKFVDRSLNLRFLVLVLYELLEFAIVARSNLESSSLVTLTAPSESSIWKN